MKKDLNGCTNCLEPPLVRSAAWSRTSLDMSLLNLITCVCVHVQRACVFLHYVCLNVCVYSVFTS